MEKLIIFGSYESSLASSTVLIGHDNVNYVVGGNAANSLRSNIIDWELSTDRTSQINTINSIFQFNDDMLALIEKDSFVLSDFIQDMNKLHDNELLLLLEKSMNLKESIVIVLRRLFYIIQVLIPGSFIKFCPYEPEKRIQDLLIDINDDFGNSDNNIDISKIKIIICNINTLIDKKKALMISSSTKAEEIPSIIENDINIDMEIFMKRYINLYPTLVDIEKINIEIAEQISVLITTIKIN
jgi:hypothetical protein